MWANLLLDIKVNPRNHVGCNFPSYLNNFAFDTSIRKRRIYTEEKAKVVAAAWGTKLIQFLAALAVLLQNDMKKLIN